MWQDYYLKFPDAQAFADVGGVMAEMAAVDDIGTLFRNDTGAASEGYHVNVRMAGASPLPAPLVAYRIAAPAMPKRAFMREV